MELKEGRLHGVDGDAIGFGKGLEHSGVHLFEVVAVVHEALEPEFYVWVLLKTATQQHQIKSLRPQGIISNGNL